MTAITCLECSSPVTRIGDMCPVHAPDYVDLPAPVETPIEPWADETDMKGDWS